MDNEDVNELLESNQAVGVWLYRLTRVAATLYEIDHAVRDIFEPARKQLAESIAWLEFEGQLDLTNSTVTEAISVLKRSLPKAAEQWHAAALAARAALGDTMVRELLDRNEARTNA